MKVTTKGQVTIPLHIRRHLGVEPHTEVEFSIRNGVVILAKANSLDTDADGRSMFEAYRGSNSQGLSTEEWMTATRGD